jgi:hypothetical protein
VSSVQFKEAYQFGLIGESAIATWLRSRENHVLPVYEIENDNKGPRLYAPDRALIATDMFVFSRAGRACLWVEAKTKTGFSPLRRQNRDGKNDVWQTGIDKKHFKDYCAISEESGWPVWLLFLQNGGQVKDSPSESPSGLYGNDISILKENIDHEHPNPPPRYKPMVYWNIYDLRRLATIEIIGNKKRLVTDPDGPWEYINDLF